MLAPPIPLVLGHFHGFRKHRVRFAEAVFNADRLSGKVPSEKQAGVGSSPMKVLDIARLIHFAGSRE